MRAASRSAAAAVTFLLASSTSATAALSFNSSALRSFSDDFNFASTRVRVVSAVLRFSSSNFREARLSSRTRSALLRSSSDLASAALAASRVLLCRSQFRVVLLEFFFGLFLGGLRLLCRVLRGGQIGLELGAALGVLVRRIGRRRRTRFVRGQLGLERGDLAQRIPPSALRQSTAASNSRITPQATGISRLG